MEDNSHPLSLSEENRRLQKQIEDCENQRQKEKFLLQKLNLYSKNTPLAIIDWDLESRATEWNEAAQIIFGYSKEEAFGKKASELIVPESAREYTDKIWHHLYANTGGTHATNENIKKNGETIICEWYNAPIINEMGEVEGVSSMALDITEKRKNEKRLREVNERFKLLSELTFEGIVLHENGIVLDINKSLEKLTLYSREEIIGQNFIELFFLDEYKPLVYENVKKNKVEPYEIKGRRKDGVEIWVEVEAKNSMYQGREIRTAALRNIQKRKEAQQNLKSALIKAQESDRLKSTFLSTISHELRTPLNAVIGFSDLIDESMDISEAVELSKMILSSGNHLLQILNDIFDLSMLEEGPIVLLKEKHNLHELLDEIKEYISVEQRTMNKTAIELIFKLNAFERDLEIITDQKRFKQIFIHLLKNALKYTKEGFVEMGYTLLPETIQFYVKDSGIGIPKDKQKNIFEIFRQLDDSHTREYEGVGIGLSIAKILTENLDGNISLKSEVGKGSCFYVNFPFKVKKEVRESPKTPKVIDLSILYGKTVLIAEDDANSYELLEMYLKPWKIKILWAKNGLEAIDIYTKNRNINLILMDVKMPILSGYEATKEIKLMNPKVPIIAQTAFAINNEKEIALQAGCDDYVAKPISWPKLSEKMAIHLKRLESENKASE
jgi:PAS domain S-box-containing protein